MPTTDQKIQAALEEMRRLCEDARAANTVTARTARRAENWVRDLTDKIDLAHDKIDALDTKVTETFLKISIKANLILGGIVISLVTGIIGFVIHGK